MASRKGAGPADRKRPLERGTSESPSPPPASAAEVDALLVERLKNGDRQASQELIQRYQEKAFAIAFRMLSGDREEALDLTQDAFLTALRKIDGFEGKSSFYTWFYRILINTCLDFLRRRSAGGGCYTFGGRIQQTPASLPKPLQKLPVPNRAPTRVRLLTPVSCSGTFAVPWNSYPTGSG